MQIRPLIYDKEVPSSSAVEFWTLMNSKIPICAIWNNNSKTMHDPAYHYVYYYSELRIEIRVSYPYIYLPIYMFQQQNTRFTYVQKKELEVCCKAGDGRMRDDRSEITESPKIYSKLCGDHTSLLVYFAYFVFSRPGQHPIVVVVHSSTYYYPGIMYNERDSSITHLTRPHI